MSTLTPNSRLHAQLAALCLGLVLCPAAPPRAAAQTTTAPGSPAAPVPPAPSAHGAGHSYRELIKKAVQEYELNNWAEAKLFFSDAHALNPNARTMRGLGLVAYALRDYVEAASWFQQALDSQAEALPEKLRAEVSEYLRLSQHFLAHLRLVIDPASAEVRLDDKTLDHATITAVGGLAINPGPHELLISQAGYETIRRRLDLDAGSNIELSFRLNSLTPPAPPPPPPQPVAASLPPPETKPAPEPAAPFIGGWVLAGASGAVAIAGGVLVAVALSDVSKVEDAEYKTEWSAVEGSFDRSPAFSAIGFSMLGVGLAGVAAGVVWQVVEDDQRKEKQVTLRLARNGLQLRGSF